jgi:hypothetical protein
MTQKTEPTGIAKCQHINTPRRTKTPKNQIKYSAFIYCQFIDTFINVNRKSRLRVFENRVLRRIFGPKRDEVTEE